KKLTDVRRSDFRVFMKQQRKIHSDIILCLDTSGSMGFQHKLIYTRLAASGLIKAAIKNEDRVGIVAFDNYSKITVPLSEENNDAISDCISKLYARGNTNIGDGIKTASELLLEDGKQNEKHIILITDGQPTAISQGTFEQLKKMEEKDLTEESTIMETRKAVAKGIKVSVIHVADKNDASSEFVKNVARAGKGNIHRIGNVKDL
ncbi:MAG: VWA domain-containing protein, partial [Dehalococcoidales bacterium]|nr:VWA domain-containing protein [Dehalococcoidales bacterium]